MIQGSAYSKAVFLVVSSYVYLALTIGYAIAVILDTTAIRMLDIVAVFILAGVYRFYYPSAFRRLENNLHESISDLLTQVKETGQYCDRLSAGATRLMRDLEQLSDYDCDLDEQRYSHIYSRYHTLMVQQRNVYEFKSALTMELKEFERALACIIKYKGSFLCKG